MKTVKLFFTGFLLSIASPTFAQSGDLQVDSNLADLDLIDRCLLQPILCDRIPIPVLKPDLTVAGIRAGGCTGSGGQPIVVVTVRNDGLLPAEAWLDVFLDRPSAPSLGDLSSIFRMSPRLNAGDSQIMRFSVDRRYQARTIWIDAIIDTVDNVDEYDDETNNILSRRVALPDCSFN